MAFDLSISTLNYSSMQNTTSVHLRHETITTMVELSERFQAALKHAGSTVSAVAAATGLSYQALKKVYDGKTKSQAAPNNRKIAEFLGVSSDWLSEGIGEMTPPAAGLAAAPQPAPADSPPPSMQPVLAWEHEDDLPAGEFVLIPRLNIKLSAGPGHEQVEIEFVDKQPQAFRADWIRKKQLKPKKLASMVADGDSMEDRIHRGDALVVDTSQTTVIDGKVYAIWYDGGERVKRLYRLPGGGLKIKSDNDTYPAIELSADTVELVRIIGRVVHVAGEGGL